MSNNEIPNIEIATKYMTLYLQYQIHKHALSNEAIHNLDSFFEAVFKTFNV